MKDNLTKKFNIILKPTQMEVKQIPTARQNHANNTQ